MGYHVHHWNSSCSFSLSCCVLYLLSKVRVPTHFLSFTNSYNITFHRTTLPEVEITEDDPLEAQPAQPSYGSIDDQRPGPGPSRR